MSSLEKTAAILYGEKKYLQALDIYLSLYRKNPKTEKYSIFCGNCFDAMGKTSQAIRFYKKASKLNPVSLSTLLGLSHLYYQKKDYARATFFAQRALKIENTNVSAWLTLANVAYCQGNFEKALSYYQKAYDQNNESYIALINMANTCFDLKTYALAIDYAHKALKLFPSSVDAYLIRGNSYLELGKFTKAEQELLMAHELNHRNPWIYNALSRLFQKLERWDEALAAGWKAVLYQNESQDEQHISFGYLLYEYVVEKQGTLAESFARKWLDKFADNQTVLYMASAILNNQQLKRADPQYVCKIFDHFAIDFDETLIGLDYQAPRLIAEILKKIYHKPLFCRPKVLDLGCGTGLCAQKIKPILGWSAIDGVDLSAKMLDQAQSKKIYRRLVEMDLVQFLSDCPFSYSIVTAADVLTYFGDLKALFALTAKVLSPKGVFIFTVSENRINDADYHLMPSGRFVHNINAVQKLLKHSGLKVLESTRKALRTEGDKIVYGYIVAARKEFSIT